MRQRRLDSVAEKVAELKREAEGSKLSRVRATVAEAAGRESQDRDVLRAASGSDRARAVVRGQSDADESLSSNARPISPTSSATVDAARPPGPQRNARARRRSPPLTPRKRFYDEMTKRWEQISNTTAGKFLEALRRSNSPSSAPLAGSATAPGSSTASASSAGPDNDSLLTLAGDVRSIKAAVQDLSVQVSSMQALRAEVAQLTDGVRVMLESMQGGRRTTGTTTESLT